MRRHVHWAGLAALIVMTGTGAEAATLRVPSEYATIQSGIDAAAFGDTVLVAPGTYTNCDEEPCTSKVAELFEGVTLLSEGGPDVTRLELVEGGPSSGLNVVYARNVGPEGVHVEGFEIRSGIPNSHGGGFVDCWNVGVVNCRFVDIETSFSSGGGLISNSGSIEITGCEFLRCRATLEGGGLKVIGDFPPTGAVVRDCLFEECGPTAFIASGGGNLEVTGCVFRNNFGTEGAGGLTAFGTDEAIIVGNLFVGNTTELGAGLIVSGVKKPAYVAGNSFLRNHASDGGGGLMIISPGEYTENTFVGNEAPIGTAILDRELGGGVDATHNILAIGVGGAAYHTTREVRTGDCNVFWSNSGGDHSGYTPGPNDLFVDPQFCDIPADDYTVRSTSPCAEENSPVCGQIGAHGLGCGTVSVEETSWGSLKALYRREE
jgi:hypothetical protein